MKIRNSFAAFSALLLLSGNVWAASTFSTLYAFGDSLSDAGSSDSAVMSLYKILGNNCDPTHFCPPYFDGRISNGPVASEQLAAALFPTGVTPTNFHSYAVAGANTGDSNSGFNIGGLIKLPGMKQEVDNYLSDAKGAADPNGLYFLWGGANDFFTGDPAATAAHNIAGYVSALANAGAKHFLVPNLSDLSQTPDQNGAPEAHAYSLAFNSELATQLGNLHAQFPGTDISSFDTYSFFNGVIQDPAKFGFTNVQSPCVSFPDLFPCGNPDGHVFWDSIHPTTRAHGVIASAFASVVPEPEMISMFIAGLIVLGFAGRTGRKLRRPEYARMGSGPCPGIR
ncbi:SGNH/GDSL hydrolase family protein [Nitrosovibrio tenuis]|uniref:Phospholipase/lecithinase/hemolysin n=1 Tax=Nitrosovibrio tenuis TaxID=1233 RepID=A0A1H7I4A1_9PROT|nr:SGNH/GDSL hydrolase family protein [Nitrosovibrio tenuis]SEK57349.1 Phospholipase/lecithinase/hemolysin [Nitrosovibrio tenuis]